MGFFFLLAGYFTPASLERKGYGRFIGDRFLRLGMPLLAFGLILGPLTAAIVTSAQGDGFWPTFADLWQRKQFINGPLWFAQALLIFSLGYCVWRAAPRLAARRIQAHIQPVPSDVWWLLSALAVGVAALAIRQFVPVARMSSAFNSLTSPPTSSSSPWASPHGASTGCANSAGTMRGPGSSPSSRLAAAAAGNCRSRAHQRPGKIQLLRRSLLARHPLRILGAVRRLGSDRCVAARLPRAHESAVAFWDWLNRRAYAVYIIHPPVLVGIALLMHGWAAPALVKFGIVGLLACTATWLLADPLVRLPGVRRIV